MMRCSEIGDVNKVKMNIQAKYKKAFLTLAILLLIFMHTMAGTQKIWPHTEKACGDTSQLLLDSEGKPKRFSSNQLKEMAINKVVPKYPESCRCEGTVFVQVFVNIKGEVACMIVLSGLQVFEETVKLATKEWKFKPLVRDGKPVSFIGFLVFNFKSNGEVMLY
jgi:hypothetical protein